MHDVLFTRLFWHVSGDRVTWICDSQGAYSAVFSTCSAQFSAVATLVMMDTSFGQCGIVLCFRLPQGWPLSDHFQRLLVPQHVLSTFHNQLEPKFDRLR